MNEKPAKGVRGFLLWNSIDKTHFFRVYNEEGFTDYDINSDDIEIEILDESISIYDTKVDYSSKVLGK